jgi:hypothetical protein
LLLAANSPTLNRQVKKMAGTISQSERPDNPPHPITLASRASYFEFMFILLRAGEEWPLSSGHCEAAKG